MLFAYVQDLDPLRNQPLSTVVAALPVVVLFYLLVGRRWLASWAGLAGAVEAIVFSPKDESFASAGADGAIRFWRLDGTPLAAIETRTGRIKSLAYSPDGRFLASGGADGAVRLWNVVERIEAAAVKAHKNTVYGVAFSSDGKRLASASFDRTVGVWSVEAK